VLAWRHGGATAELQVALARGSWSSSRAATAAGARGHRAPRRRGGQRAVQGRAGHTRDLHRVPTSASSGRCSSARACPRRSAGTDHPTANLSRSGHLAQRGRPARSREEIGPVFPQPAHGSVGRSQTVQYQCRPRRCRVRSCLPHSAQHGGQIAVAPARRRASSSEATAVAKATECGRMGEPRSAGAVVVRSPLRWSVPHPGWRRPRPGPPPPQQSTLLAR
jgi:hypothetical protein